MLFQRLGLLVLSLQRILFYKQHWPHTYLDITATTIDCLVALLSLPWDFLLTYYTFVVTVQNVLIQ